MPETADYRLVVDKRDQPEAPASAAAVRAGRWRVLVARPRRRARRQPAWLTVWTTWLSMLTASRAAGWTVEARDCGGSKCGQQSWPSSGGPRIIAGGRTT